VGSPTTDWNVVFGHMRFHDPLTAGEQAWWDQFEALCLQLQPTVELVDGNFAGAWRLRGEWDDE
jgi:hypothetical protein